MSSWPKDGHGLPSQSKHVEFHKGFVRYKSVLPHLAQGFDPVLGESPIAG